MRIKDLDGLQFTSNRLDETKELLNPTKENPDEKFGKDFTDELMEEKRE